MITEPSLPAGNSTRGLHFDSPRAAHTHAYLWPHVLKLLPAPPLRVLDLGCGNGFLSGHLHRHGYEVVGVDPSPTGIALARASFPDIHFIQSPAQPELSQSLEPFPAIVCLEVIEHLSEPRVLVRTIRRLLSPGGVAIVSTPYHGYWKNLALALTNRLETHFTALWDGGHVKFWSIRTLTTLFSEQGFQPSRIIRAGRIPCLAKSMIIAFRAST